MKRKLWITSLTSLLTLAIVLVSALLLAASASAASPSPASSADATKQAEQKNPPPTKDLQPLTVLDVNPAMFKTKAQDGSLVNVHTTASTIYVKAGQKISRSEIRVGTQIYAKGEVAKNGDIDALGVAVALPSYEGTITSIKGNTIIVNDKKAARTVLVTDKTQIFIGKQQGKLSDLHVGDIIVAEGDLNKDGSLTALLITQKPLEDPGKGTPPAK